MESPAIWRGFFILKRVNTPRLASLVNDVKSENVFNKNAPWACPGETLLMYGFTTSVYSIKKGGIIFHLFLPQIYHELNLLMLWSNKDRKKDRTVRII